MFRKKQKEVIKTAPEIIGDNAPFAFNESYNSLRTNLDFMTFSGEIKVISVTSSIPNEGKSSISINLARALSIAGNKVLLIDADLRAPSIHRYINVRNMGVGFSSVLSGQVDINEVIYQYKPLEINVILSGPIPPNPSELLMREKTQEILTQLKEKYDYIIIDTPPSVMVSDAKIISRVSDGTLFVVRHKFTDRNVVKDVIKQLQGPDQKVLGIVFNNYETSGSDTTYTYGYGNSND